MDISDDQSYHRTMKQIAAAKFKEQCLALLDSVDEDGIVITKRGKPVAKLVPMSAAAPKVEVFRRVGGLRGRMTLPKGETVKDLIDAGRRL